MSDNVIQLPAKRPTVQGMTREALELVQEQFDRYIIFPSDEARDAVVLWTLHTHIFRAFDATPRLSVRSREPGSGKSRVLDVLEHLVPSPMNCAYLTPGVMWRKIEHGSPTILFDEADTVFGANGSSSSHRELRGIINAGHRSNGKIPRCVGAEGIHEFHVFSPVALAGIGRLPETIATRSVEIVMRKKQAGDRDVESFRIRFAQDDLANAKKKLEEWSKAAFKPLTLMMPELPVSERAADVWEPLICIAVMAGGDWAERGRKAAVALTKQAAEKPVTAGVQLLSDIRQAFRDDTVLDSGELLDRLHGQSEGRYVKGLFGTRDVARMVKEYGIKSQTIRVNGDPVRGYKREAFEHAWGAHL